MDIVQTIVLAIVQGVTEFLPISISGHLVLTPAFAGWADQGLAFDMAVHFGTLGAVVSYFRGELLAMARSMLVGSSPEARLARQVVVATVPLGVAGLVFAILSRRHYARRRSLRLRARVSDCCCGSPTGSAAGSAVNRVCAGRTF